MQTKRVKFQAKLLKSHLKLVKCQAKVAIFNFGKSVQFDCENT